MSKSSNNVVRLPDDFIGKEDEVKLESFGAHLIARGAATRWQWLRSGGFDVELEILRGGRDEELLARIGRDRSRRVFYAIDAWDQRIAEGPLDRVMAVVDAVARSDRPDPSA